MPTVRDLAAPYENILLAPQHGPGVCSTCFNLTDGFAECYACTRSPRHLDALAPISYSVAHEQLHHALAAYKRVNGVVGRRLAIQLAAVLWRYVEAHERCVAEAAGAARFDLVATVPSGDPGRDEHHPLRWIVGELIAPTRSRHARLLRRTAHPAATHQYSPEKYRAEGLNGETILLIDDTWTTGASAQSAARALKAAGAGAVAAVVIGRHINREWRENDRRLRAIPRPFDWNRCVVCAPPARPTA